MKPPILPAVAAMLLAGCATVPPAARPAASEGAKASAATAAPTRARTIASTARLAQPQVVPGAEGVIGADAAALIRQFGAPRLDVIEGDARKLQWSGAACVLDAYLYPPAAGREPLASYIEARRASDAQDVDRAACIAALRQS